MTLGHPAALFLLWLGLVVWAAHRRRRSRVEVRVPSLALLPEAVVEGPGASGAPADRLLLALRLLALAGVVLALAAPRLLAGPPDRLVLVVDVSASMAAPDPDRPDDPGRSRLVAAREAAAATVRELGPRRVLVLAAGAAPRAAGGWTGPEGALAALAGLVAEDGPADLASALAEAEGLAGPAGAVRVFADGQAPIPGNRAIAALTFRPHLHAVERGDFLVTVRRGPAAPGDDPGDIDVFVRIDVGGAPAGRVRVGVGAGGEASGSLAYRGPGGAPARAAIDGGDPLAADDQAFVPVPRLTRRTLALVGPDNPELRRALSAWPRADVTVRPAGLHPAADLLVLQGEGPERLGPDRAAVLVRPPGPERAVAPVGAPPGDRPGYAAVAALQVVAAGPVPAPPAGARTVLSDAGGAPLLWVRTSPGPSRAALAFDPGASGLAGDPLHAVFWADLLQDLLLPDDGGCRRVPVGWTSAQGALTRVGLYELDEGCVIATMPDAESRPAGPAAPAGGGEVRPGAQDLAAAPARPGRPIAAGLVLLAAAAMLLEAVAARRSRARRDPRRLPGALRAGVVAALALTLWAPWGPADRPARTAMVVDGSPSVPRRAAAQALARAEGWAAASGGPDRAQVVPITESDLAEALRGAGRLVGAGGVVTLLSDGRAAPGSDPVAAAAALRRRDVTTNTAPVFGAGRDVWVDAVAAPRGVRAGETAAVTAVVRRVGDVGAGDVLFRAGGVEVARERLDLTDVHAATATVRVRFAEPGRQEVRAALVGFPDSGEAANDEGGAYVLVTGAVRTLRVGRPAAPGLLGPALEAAGHEVAGLAPAALTPSPAELAAWDLVVLDDVAASDLPAGGPQALANYAQAGGGLLLGGGPRAFGPGGYAGTGLDGVAPVRSDPRQAGGRLAAVLLLDKSGSMGGAEGGWERLLLAKATLRSLLRAFRRPDDRVGVLGYDTDAVVVMPMTAVADVQAEFVDTGNLTPAGGTDPTRALELALDWLGPAERYPLRHVIVVSDGRFPGLGAEAKVRQLRDGGVRTSTVAVGVAADHARLRAIAASGGGDHAVVTELTDLPSAVARHLLSVDRAPVALGRVDLEAGADLGGLLPSPPARFPPLMGLVRTALADDAHLWLAATTGEPVLAGRRAGAGRTAAWTSDLAGGWSAPWAGWSAGRDLLAAVAAWTARRPDGGWEAVLWEDGDDAGVTFLLDAVDGGGRPAVHLSPRAVFDLPGGGREELPMAPVAPGRYAASLPVDDGVRGAFAAAAVVDDAVVGRAALLRLCGRELRDRGDDLRTLGAIAAAGGGRLIPADGAPPVPAGLPGDGEPGRGWPLLLALGLFLAYLSVEGRAPVYRGPRPH